MHEIARTVAARHFLISMADLVSEGGLPKLHQKKASDVANSGVRKFFFSAFASEPAFRSDPTIPRNCLKTKPDEAFPVQKNFSYISIQLSPTRCRRFFAAAFATADSGALSFSSEVTRERPVELLLRYFRRPPAS